MRQLALLTLCLAALAGCADGPLPEARYLNPWARQQWEADERAITTYHKKVADLAALRSQATRLPPEQAEQVSAQLAARLQEEQAPVLRAELVKTLGEFRTQSAQAAVQNALADETPHVRLAACKALGRQPSPEAAEALAQRVATDEDLDVQIAAATALGNFTDPNLPADQRRQLAQSLRPALDARDPALQVAAMQSLATITRRDDYRSDAATWRAFLDGENPAPPAPPTLAELLQRSLIR